MLFRSYMTTGKTIVLTVGTFVDKVMSLLFNMLSRLVYSFSSKEQAYLFVCVCVCLINLFFIEE